MSTEEAVVPKSLDCDSAQQEQKFAINKDEGKDRDKDRSNRVTLRSDSDSMLSKDKLINLIWRELFNVTEECVLVYEGVDIKTAHSVIEELDRRMEGKTQRLSYNSLLKTLKLVLMPSQIHDYPLGNVRTLQQETIFPVPPAQIAASQSIRITRGQLFGPTLPDGQNPALVTHLNLNELRHIANEYLRDEGYVPAP
ncbi:hypothetical protein VTN77DRAFT_5588 [Rasamsonia byssochlamydoides]|uniref:uncharacterized protein n=1 Tax=Rasamsonia byssochlamydoides TaxID=89139 RepID=UPI00374246EC